MITVTQARDFVLSSCHPLSTVEVSTGDALGLVLAEAVRSDVAVPPFANSSMDGYAVRANDVKDSPARLRVVGEVTAGDDAGALEVGEGETVRIMTGAMIPRGADAVCMVEHTRSEDGWAFIDEPVAAGTNVRLAGGDIAPGTEVFPAGVRLGPAHLGVLASIAVEQVTVFPRPRVGVVSTGDELMTGPGLMPPGKIRDSNRVSLLARLRADGFVGIDLGPGPRRARRPGPNPATSGAELRRGADERRGERGRPRLREIGPGRTRRPTRPLVASGGEARKTVRVFGFAPKRGARFRPPRQPRLRPRVSYELFARPSLRLMAGHRHLDRPRLRATTEVALPREPDGRLHLARVRALIRPDGVVGRAAIRWPGVEPAPGAGGRQRPRLFGRRLRPGGRRKR